MHPYGWLSKGRGKWKDKKINWLSLSMKDGEREASSIMMLYMRRVEDIWSLPSWTPFYKQMDICDSSSLTVKTVFAITNIFEWIMSPLMDHWQFYFLELIQLTNFNFLICVLFITVIVQYFNFTGIGFPVCALHNKIWFIHQYRFHVKFFWSYLHYCDFYFIDYK